MYGHPKHAPKGEIAGEALCGTVERRFCFSGRVPYPDPLEALRERYGPPLRACLRPREGTYTPKTRRSTQNAGLTDLGYNFAPVRNRSLAGRNLPTPKAGQLANFLELRDATDAGGTRNDGRRIPVHAFTPVMSRFRTHFQTKADLGNWQPSKIKELPMATLATQATLGNFRQLASFLTRKPHLHRTRGSPGKGGVAAAVWALLTRFDVSGRAAPGVGLALCHGVMSR